MSTTIIQHRSCIVHTSFEEAIWLSIRKIAILPWAPNTLFQSITHTGPVGQNPWSVHLWIVPCEKEYFTQPRNIIAFALHFDIVRKIAIAYIISQRDSECTSTLISSQYLDNDFANQEKSLLLWPLLTCRLFIPICGCDIAGSSSRR